ncbi:MAG: phosphoribosylanthranilate isomerase [Dehalococcoidia bacterium]|nr:phosphoribosylanthranilate isomerase [Dehalococcoidia bacterium]
MNAQDARMCVRYGADIVGFVVDYPRPVPWNISIECARELIVATPKPAQTCIVTGGSLDKILHITMEAKPDYIQLHSTETLEETSLIVRELAECDVKVIKTIFPHMPDLEKSAVDFCAAGVFALLFDPRTPDNAIGSGLTDIPAFVKIKHAVNCPVIFAGGITPDNVCDIVLKTKAQAIDLMTGVERKCGIKDEEKVATLFSALQDR